MGLRLIRLADLNGYGLMLVELWETIGVFLGHILLLFFLQGTVAFLFGEQLMIFFLSCKQWAELMVFPSLQCLCFAMAERFESKFCLTSSTLIFQIK